MLTQCHDQEWGLSFPPERIKAMQKASKLQRIATVEVSVAPLVKLSEQKC